MDIETLTSKQRRCNDGETTEMASVGGHAVMDNLQGVYVLVGKCVLNCGTFS